MDTLDGETWDVVIVGTGISESLLALSLSRSGKRILHLDPNPYYGGPEAALSLSEAEDWAKQRSTEHGDGNFSHAGVRRTDAEGDVKLASSRAYSIALAPHLIYSRSNLISTVVSAKIHNQLEFQAVGSWFVLDSVDGGTSLTKVPGGREDVFADTSLDLKSKRSLMKFLRFVTDYEEKRETWEEDKDNPFPAFLQGKFGLPAASLAPILALTMSEGSPSETSTELALSRIARHARSIGTFGPGFGAVLPKWGGLAEVSQVACRACAVGGGVYVLDKQVENLSRQDGDHPVALELGGGEKVTTKFVASSNASAMGAEPQQLDDASTSVTSKSISIVASPLADLFPPTSEGGVTPAGAVVVAPASSDDGPPVHIFAHTSEAGECPSGQCVLYASVALASDGGFARLEHAVHDLLQSIGGESSSPEVLWRVQYEQAHRQQSQRGTYGCVVGLPSLRSSLALDDDILVGVTAAWQAITGRDEDAFMQFNVREGAGDEDE